MFLTLVPPDTLTIPATLQTHAIPLPTWPTGARIPIAWKKSRGALSSVGIAVPSAMCADLTASWAFAVRDVMWNLDSDLITVTLTDGTYETFDFDGGNGLSNLAIESNEHVSSSHDNDATDQRSPVPTGSVCDYGHSSSTPLGSSQQNTNSKQASRTDAASHHEDVGKRQTVAASRQSQARARLLDLCQQLREAYEDLGLGVAALCSEADHAQLIQMAGNPTLKVPEEWDGSAQSLFEFHMQGASEEEDDDHEQRLRGDDVDGTSSDSDCDEESSQRIGEAVQEDARRSRREISPNFTMSPQPSTSRTKTARPVRGQLRDRRRPRNLAEAAGEPKHAAIFAPHDYLSFVDLLSQARKTMIGMFASLVIPELKQRLNSVNYSQWVVKSALKWYQSRAYVLSGRLANHILELLDRDDDVDVSDVENLTDELASDEDRPNAAQWLRPSGMLQLQQGFLRVLSPTVRNPLRDMQDDFELRLWCEKVCERAHEVETTEKWAGQDQEDGVVAAGPKFSSLARPHEITKRLPSQLGRRSGLRTASHIRQNFIDTTPTKLAKKRSSKPEVDSDATDSDDDVQDRLLTLFAPAGQSPKFFYTEDLLGESFVPPKLPRALVDRDEGSRSDEDVERARKRIHKELNELAGLQKRMVELMDSAASTSARPPSELRVRLNYSQPKSVPSKLRNPVMSSSKDEASKAKKSKSSGSPPATLPLRLQPLRLRTADKSVASAITKAIEKNPSAQRAAVKAIKHSNSTLSARENTDRSPRSPRKRARDNLSQIQSVKSLTSSSQRKARKRQGSKAPGSSSRVDDSRSPLKKRQKKKSAIPIKVFADARQYRDEQHKADNTQPFEDEAAVPAEAFSPWQAAVESIAKPSIDEPDQERPASHGSTSPRSSSTSPTRPAARLTSEALAQARRGSSIGQGLSRTQDQIQETTDAYASDDSEMTVEEELEGLFEESEMHRNAHTISTFGSLLRAAGCSSDGIDDDDLVYHLDEDVINQDDFGETEWTDRLKQEQNEHDDGYDSDQEPEESARRHDRERDIIVAENNHRDGIKVWLDGPSSHVISDLESLQADTPAPSSPRLWPTDGQNNEGLDDFAMEL
ncbi:hypothetical protein OIO90_002104 [Microbotryomycetes sp. JL221]|nr:hypothetical protein OIO90_002104 [Microbotryomycetes sp. JL221]